MDSFWGTLKNELTHCRRYETRARAVREITKYIEIFDNRQRRHSKLGYLAPDVFAQKCQQQATRLMAMVSTIDDRIYVAKR